MIHVVFTDLLACLCILAGLFFMLVGAIGIVRFPDGFNRLHASSKCSTLGLLGLLLGALLFAGTLGIAAKAMLTLLFAFVATPVGSHILAKAAHIDGLRQWPKTLSDELAEDYPERHQRDEAADDRDPLMLGASPHLPFITLSSSGSSNGRGVVTPNPSSSPEPSDGDFEDDDDDDETAAPARSRSIA